MPSTYSPSLRLELIGSGEQAGTWGATTNTNLGTLLEQSIAGVQAITMTDVNYTLSNLNGLSDEARQAILVVSGTNAAIRDVIAPLAKKSYVIKNGTTGGFAILIRAATGTSVSVPNGATCTVYCDGTNFILASLSTSYTANAVLLGNSSSSFQEVAPGTSGNVLTSNGTTWTSTAIPSSSGVTKGQSIAFAMILGS